MPEREPDERLLAALLRRRPAVRDIVRLMSRGATRKEVACALSLSQHTVDWHLRRLYRDAGLSGAVQLAVLWERAVAFDKSLTGDRGSS